MRVSHGSKRAVSHRGVKLPLTEEKSVITVIVIVITVNGKIKVS